MSSGAGCLETYLKIYEDVCLFWESHNKARAGVKLPIGAKRLPPIYQTGGATANWRGFRQALLNIGPRMSDQEIMDAIKPFMLERRSISNRKELMDTENCFNALVQFLAFWMRDSRRVFSISEDLQLLLNATSLDGITLADVRFPFRCFVVSFANTIHIDKLANGDVINANIDAVFVSVDEVNDKIAFWPMSANPGYKPVSRAVRMEVERYVARKNWFRVERLLAPQEKNCWNRGLAYVIGSNLMLKPVTEVAHFLDRGRDEELCDQFTRIVVSMCLYLKTLPSTSPHVSKWEPRCQNLSTDRLIGITDISHVCEVSTQFKLSSEERDTLKQHTGEMMKRDSSGKSPHCRRGYWHRPLGSGCNENATKTEWTRPTIVNAHLLRQGEVPKGANTILLR